MEPRYSVNMVNIYSEFSVSMIYRRKHGLHVHVYAHVTVTYILKFLFGYLFVLFLFYNFKLWIMRAFYYTSFDFPSSQSMKAT